MTQDHDARSSEDRIAALESQVHRLEGLLAGGGGGQDQQAHSAYDRRSLLRRGGAALAAGAAGAMVLPQLTGTAAAANGDPVNQGQTNTAGAATTLDRNTNDGNPTLIVKNGTSAESPGTRNSALGSPPLRVTPGPIVTLSGVQTALGPDATSSQSGDMFVQAGVGGVPTQLLFTHESATGSGTGNNAAAIGSVYTDYLANLFVPVKQDSSARAAHLILPKGGVGQINFTPFLAPNGFLVAAVGVLQVGKGQAGNGYLTLFPNGTSRPSISALTWLYPNDRLSTLAIAIPGNGNIVNVFASLGAEVFFDVVGLLVPSPASVADAHLAPGAVTSNAVRAEKLRKQHATRF
jgi:hypothetical protein